jgi:hypothetical protein
LSSFYYICGRCEGSDAQEVAKALGGLVLETNQKNAKKVQEVCLVYYLVYEVFSY